MPVLPNKINERIAWFEQRMAAWTTNAAAIGLTPAQATSIAGLVTAARAAFDAAQTARQDAKNATVSQKSAVTSMDGLGADLVKTIRAFAQTTDNNNVFVLASIPPPAPPTPAGAPLPPTDLSAAPNADGTITLKWKGSVANQTFFTVWRKVGTSGAWTQIGSLAKRKFIDAAVPAPTGPGAGTTVFYNLRAQRGTAVSAPSDTTTVQFGSQGGDGAGLAEAA
jgi:hypothetical protein